MPTVRYDTVIAISPSRARVLVELRAETRVVAQLGRHQLHTTQRFWLPVYQFLGGCPERIRLRRILTLDVLPERRPSWKTILGYAMSSPGFACKLILERRGINSTRIPMDRLNWLNVWRYRAASPLVFDLTPPPEEETEDA